MPEDGTAQIVFLLLEVNAERFRAVRRFETHAMIKREPPRSFTLGGWVPVARAECIHDLHANRRARHSLDTCPLEQHGSLAREAQGAPAIRRNPRRHTHANHSCRPAERSDAERDPGGRTAGAEWYDDGVGWRLELYAELERRETMSEHRAGVGATAWNPVWRPFPNTTRGKPGAEHGPRQRCDARRAHDQVRLHHDRRADGAGRFGRRLLEQRERSAVALRPGAARGRQTVARTAATDGHE